MSDYTTEELLDAVRAHSRRNYNHNGWDYVEECFSDAEVIEAIGRARTPKGAIRNVAKHFGLKVKADQRADIQATAW